MWPSRKEPEPAQMLVTVSFFEGTYKMYEVTLTASRERGVARTVAAALDMYRLEYIRQRGMRFATELTGIVVATAPGAI